jgi:hypothetical protein
MFALLTGQPLGKSEPSSSSSDTTSATTLAQNQGTSQQKSGPQSDRAFGQPEPAPKSSPSIWALLGLTGLFAAIRPTSAALSRAQAGKKEGMVFSSGEVHVDLIRVRSFTSVYGRLFSWESAWAD